MKSRITGIGGIFFKANDPDQLYAWYEKHLGMARVADYQAIPFLSRNEDGTLAQTLLSFFHRDTTYVDPSRASFMINYRVDDLDAMVESLRADGIEILGRQDYDFGRFAWIMDPEGNRIELWEPAKKTLEKE